MPKQPPKKPEPLVWYWRQSQETYRVWRSDWYGDQFEVFTEEDFKDFCRLAERLSEPVIEAED